MIEVLTIPGTWPRALAVALGALTIVSCSHPQAAAKMSSEPSAAIVGTTPVVSRPVAQHLTVSAELVPFQEIDVYAKEPGYVKTLNVDYGTHVKAGQVMAVLEVPELEAQLQQDQSAIKAQQDEITRAMHEVGRSKAQHQVFHLQYKRLAEVAKSKTGLVAQQEVDDAQGKDLASESQVDAVEGAWQAALSQLAVAKAKLAHDQALFDYSKITAPFDGVVTQRYANYGALMQAGTSSTQATPLVRLSQVNLFRLVIPVPESYVRYIKIGDPVEVRVPSLGRSFNGQVKRFSVDVNGMTRTMHTEVDVPNPRDQLLPGVYAEAVLTLAQRGNVPVVPLQTISREGDKTSVLVVGPSDRIEERPITLGIETPNYAEVANGLRDGEQIVVSDRSGLKAGEQVRPQPAPPMVYDSSAQEQKQ